MLFSQIGLYILVIGHVVCESQLALLDASKRCNQKLDWLQRLPCQSQSRSRRDEVGKRWLSKSKCTCAKEMRSGWARCYLYGCGDWAPVVFWPVVVLYLGRLIRPTEDHRHDFRAGGLKTCSVQRQSRPHAPAVWQRGLLDYLALFRGIGMTTHLTVDPLHLRFETC
jgi:hypothetical protein